MRSIRRIVLASATVAGFVFAPAAGAAPVSVGHSGWEWGHPTPQGHTLSAVTFDGLTGYAVGSFGTAVKSTDGGQTWQGLPTGSFDSLGVVQELDPNTVIVGGGCTVAESTNGGASFSQLPVSPGPDCATVTGIGFASPTTGFVQQSGGQVVFTDDGGQTVQAKTPIPLGSSDSANDLAFISPTTGFSVTGGPSGGTVQRTTDAANSWTTVGSAGHALAAIRFVSATTAYAVGDHDTLLASTDGGATWSARPLTLPAASGTPDLTHISCSDAMNCLISLSNSRSLIRTTDGGMTGSVVTPSALVLSDVAFSTGTNVVGVGASGETVLSADGGVTFPTVVSNDSPILVSGYAPAPLRAGGQAGDAYLLGQGGLIEATTDGGGTWSILRVPGGADLVDAAFPTATAGFAITQDNVLRKTTNGGIAWSSLDAGVSESTALAATSATTVLLIGPHGIRRSHDGGQTFTKVGGTVTLPTVAGKHHHKVRKGPKISSLSVSRAFTVGHAVFAWNRTVGYESANGGTAWHELPFPARTKVDDLSFVSPSTGYVQDAAGDLLFTRNTGKTWTKLLSLGTQDLLGISFSSAQRGFAVLGSGATPESFGGDLLATTNGGRTWTPQIVDGGGDERVLATPGHAYLADPSNDGDDVTSAVFATSNGGASPQKSSLTISIGPKTLTANALNKRRHSRVTIKGRLNPVAGDGGRVLVAYRRPAKSWAHQLVNVASNGQFQVTLKHITSTTDFVVYANGDGVHGGAGAYVRLTVK
jgi:photosystem II stability/assembly factor-like uncharacterized protein